MFATATGLVMLVLWVLTLGLKVFAFVDCVRRPAAAFPAVGRQTKPLWLILTALADEKVRLQTIAPKFTGRFNKGVDYVGDLVQFEKEFNDDLAVIAHAIRQYGLPANLKLSVHSGSDKFSIYPIIRRALQRTDQAAAVGLNGDSDGADVGGQRVFRAGQVGAQHLDRARIAIGLQVVFLAGHPVAQKHVHVVLGHGGIGHGQGQDLGLGLVAKRLQNGRGQRGGGADIGPANVREDDLAAFDRILR